MNIFNGTNKFAGYYEAFNGEKATVKIKRANSTSEESIDNGFLVNVYSIGATRGVVINRFMNLDGAVAQVGTLNGTLQLQGLIGTAEGFKQLLGGSTGGSNDVCNQLVITISAAGGYTKCDGNGNSTKVNEDATFVLSGGIVNQVAITGQVDQNGIMMQSGSVSVQFTQLELK